MRFRTVTPAAAKHMQDRVRRAPMLAIDGTGCTHRVARIGYLPSGTGRELLAPGLGGDTSGIVTYFETTDGAIWRLPDGLASWAVDCVALAQSFGSPFPAVVEFGLENGEYTATFET